MCIIYSFIIYFYFLLLERNDIHMYRHIYILTDEPLDN